jgi:hypothetical protein
MSELSKNQLVSRRNFLQRATDAAKVAGLGVALRSFQSPGRAASSAPNPWAYDDTVFRQTDPKLIGYTEVRRFRSARSSPRCICLGDGDKLFIGAGNYVTQYDPAGGQVFEFKASGEIRCLAAASDGLIHVGLRDYVEVYDRQGRARTAWEGAGKQPYFTGIAVGESDVFVADAGNRIVLRYDRAGKLLGRIGQKDKERNVPGFIVPSAFFDVQIARDGLLRVTNPGRHCVEAYTFDGDLERSWGKPGASIENFCGCCNPVHLALLSDGRVVTFEKGIPRVKVYGAEGAFLCVVAGTESFPQNAAVCGPSDCTLGGLTGVVDSKERICILDLVAGDVRVMERKT